MAPELEVEGGQAARAQGSLEPLRNQTQSREGAGPVPPPAGFWVCRRLISSDLGRKTSPSCYPLGGPARAAEAPSDRRLWVAEDRAPGQRPSTAPQTAGPTRAPGGWPDPVTFQLGDPKVTPNQGNGPALPQKWPRPGRHSADLSLAVSGPRRGRASSSGQGPGGRSPWPGPARRVPRDPVNALSFPTLSPPPSAAPSLPNRITLICK